MADENNDNDNETNKNVDNVNVDNNDSVTNDTTDNNADYVPQATSNVVPVAISREMKKIIS